MPVRPLSIDLVRERLPQLLQHAKDRLMKVPLQRPSWPLRTDAVPWLSWRTVATAALLGGIVHICATFAAPTYTGGDAYRLLAEKLPLNRMVLLPPQAPGQQILSELPSDMLYAMCRYDLSGGPVAVTAAVPGTRGSALSLHTPLGSNFYVLPGQPQHRTDVSFVVVPGGPDAVPVMQRESAADTQVTSPTPRGVIVLRTPLRGLAWTAETKAILQRATCAPVEQ